MDYRNLIFYLAILLVVGAIAELYVRLNRIGESTEKVRGVVKTRDRRVGPPFILLIVAIVIAVITRPH